MKKLIRFITILFKKQVSEDDLVDLWLIPFFRRTVKETAKHYEHASKGTTAFILDHKVSKWQYKIWYFLTIQKLRKYDSQWFIERRFPFVSRYKMTVKRAKRVSWIIILDCAPSVK